MTVIAITFEIFKSFWDPRNPSKTGTRIRQLGSTPGDYLITIDGKDYSVPSKERFIAYVVLFIYIISGGSEGPINDFTGMVSSLDKSSIADYAIRIWKSIISIDNVPSSPASDRSYNDIRSPVISPARSHIGSIKRKNSGIRKQPSISMVDFETETKIKNLEEALRSSQAKQQQLYDTVLAMEKNNDAVVDQRVKQYTDNAVRSFTDQIKNYQAREEEYKTRVAILEGEVAEGDRYISQIQSSMDGNQTAGQLAANATLLKKQRQELKQLEHKFNQLERKNRLASISPKADDAKLQVEVQKRLLELSDEEKARRDHELEHLKKEIDLLNQKQRKELGKLEEENELLSQKLSFELTEKDRREREYKRAKQHIKELSDERDALEFAKQTCEEKSQKLAELNSSLQREKRNMEKHVGDLENEIERVINDFETIRERSESIHKNYNRIKIKNPEPDGDLLYVDKTNETSAAIETKNVTALYNSAKLLQDKVLPVAIPSEKDRIIGIISQIYVTCFQFDENNALAAYAGLSDTLKMLRHYNLASDIVRWGITWSPNDSELWNTRAIVMLLANLWDDHADVKNSLDRAFLLAKDKPETELESLLEPLGVKSKVKMIPEPTVKSIKDEIRRGWPYAHRNVMNFIYKQVIENEIKSGHKGPTVWPKLKRSDVEKRKIKIGYFEIILYITTDQYLPHVMDELRATKKVVVAGKSVHELRGIIEKDQVDCLVDLAGHTANNRLDVFALQPARNLYTYLGYPAHGGCNNVTWITDRFTSDNYNDPDTDGKIFLPGHFLCFTPHTQATFSQKEVLELRSKRPKRPFTFACFAKLNKLNNPTVNMWLRILDEVPDSLLLIKSRLFLDNAFSRSFTKRFIPDNKLDRVVLLPGSLGYREHMLQYMEADCMVDQSPYSGTTISWESIYMGVPVITLAKPDVSHVQRVTGSLLQEVGLGTECIAETEDQFVALAKKMAEERRYIDNDKVRDMMESSGVLNRELYVRKLERAFRNHVLSLAI
ncbi:glycosyltransferase family 41 protein [Gonapodya prolifera JEL478]|uniref:Glycosyltransferase family 41 protein n=1 Tax=Gonapodya prolifera (strain JEL478) TaxID=1344416 RepID=A0A138ZWK4_GONPJ|nr:glycosyltransferase family 41 protein [Gonapodya prolifera JEL478]|eukprot:KXS08877.1 glycosyltransferase family 41 protein [Gonapodya prolifera JEL478]